MVGETYIVGIFGTSILPPHPETMKQLRTSTSTNFEHVWPIVLEI